MADNWKWWVGADDERFSNECDTREEAVWIAQNEYDDGAYIVEAVKPDNIKLSSFFSAAQFIEDADEQAYDDHGDPWGDGGTFDLTPGKETDQATDLQNVVRAAIDEWQARHGLIFTGFKFLKQRNDEFIPPKGEDAA